VLGEHCDWAGGASLTIPLPLGVRVRAEAAREGVSAKSELDGELLEGRWSINNPRIGHAALRFVPAAIQTLNNAGIPVKPTELWIAGDLPAAKGLASSAALSLGVLDALSRFSGHHQSTATLVDLAYQLEHDALGIPCGRLDQAACAAAQPLFLSWSKSKTGEISMNARRVDPLKALHFVVATLRGPRHAKKILATLARHHDSTIPNSHGDAVREAITEFASAAEAGAYAMETGNIKALGLAMNRSQAIYEAKLAGRFESTHDPQLLQQIRSLIDLGAIGAKFSGAGGDGSVIGLFSTENSARASAISMDHTLGNAWYISVGVP